MSPNDFRLLTLGRSNLQGDEGKPAADTLRRQRRKLAVLAVLALARQSVACDGLLDMFWDEQDESRARLATAGRWSGSGTVGDTPTLSLWGHPDLRTGH